MHNCLIFDSSAVFNFGHRSGGCGHAETVLTAFSKDCKLLVPPEVKTETLQHPLESFDYETFLGRHFIVTAGKWPEPSRDVFISLAGRLGSGELAVITLGLEKKGTVVIDEKIARREAGRLNLQCTGTIGLFNEAVSNGWLAAPEALYTIKTIIQNNGRLPKPASGDTWQIYLKSINK